MSLPDDREVYRLPVGEIHHVQYVASDVPIVQGVPIPESRPVSPFSVHPRADSSAPSRACHRDPMVQGTPLQSPRAPTALPSGPAEGSTDVPSTVNRPCPVPVTLGPPVPCDKVGCQVCKMANPHSGSDRSQSPPLRPPPRGRMPPVAPKPPFIPTSPAVEKEKIMQGYVFLGKLEAYIQKSVNSAVDDLRANIAYSLRTKDELAVTVRENVTRLDQLERVPAESKDAVYEQLTDKVLMVEARVKEIEESKASELEVWRHLKNEQAEIMERIELLETTPEVYTNAQIDRMMGKKLDRSQYDIMKSHIKTTLTEFDRVVKLALEAKADKTDREAMEKECARIWKALHELVEKVERKIISKQVLLAEAIELKVDKTEIYAKEIIDAKLREKLDVPFGEQLPYEVSFVPEETFSVDMLPERSVAVPVPDTIPSKATHVQMSVQFHLTDHVSMCRFTMSTFRTATSSMDDNTKTMRVSWLSDALSEVLWTFRINGRYGRTIFAKWADDRPQWQLIREWASHYSCRAIIKAVSWEVYDEKSQPIAAISNIDYDPKLSRWVEPASDQATKGDSMQSAERVGSGGVRVAPVAEETGCARRAKYVFDDTDSEFSRREGSVFALG